MTDDELWQKLSERLGHNNMSLSELVATGESRLMDWRLKSKYARKIYNTHPECYLGNSEFNADDFWAEISCLITAPVAVRARALLEVLE